MSQEKVESVIEKFVQDSRNDLLIIKGNWGVGKTFFWHKTIKEFSSQGKVGHKNYSYVSLFGIDSFETLKNLITANQIISESIGKDSDLSFSVMFSKLKNLLKFGEKSPFLRNYSGGLISELGFYFVRNALICFDDLERTSSKIDVQDILGLASFLKEQRNCKIVFILNDEKLSNKENFSKSNEKISDLEIKFAPLADEAFSYIFNEPHPYSELIKFCCLTLEIKNIRILQRINRFIETLIPFIKDIETIIAEDVIRSIILFVYCYYNEEGNSPSLEIVEKFDTFNHIIRKQDNEKVADEEVNWYEFFKKYDYRGTNEIEKNLIMFVKNGYLDEEVFRKQIEIRNQEIIQQKGVDKYKQAWKLYTESFKDNEQEFIEKLFLGFSLNINNLDMRQLKETVSLLREFEADEKADKLIDEFVETRFDKDSATLMILGHTDYANIEDQYLNQKLNQKINEVKGEKTLGEVLGKFNSGSFSYFEDVEFLASIPEDEFYKGHD